MSAASSHNNTAQRMAHWSADMPEEAGDEHGDEEAVDGQPLDRDALLEPRPNLTHKDTDKIRSTAAGDNKTHNSFGQHRDD
jgi:hypothetical protein